MEAMLLWTVPVQSTIFYGVSLYTSLSVCIGTNSKSTIYLSIFKSNFFLSLETCFTIGL